MQLKIQWFVFVYCTIFIGRSDEPAKDQNDESITSIALRIISNKGTNAEISFAANTHETHCVWTPESFMLQSASTNFLELDSTSLTAIFHAPVRLQSSLNTMAISMSGKSDWFLWAIDTFDDGGKLWSNSTTSTCGSSSDIFLGGHCKFGPGSVSQRTYTDLPPHTFMRITARLHLLDKWLGETVLVKLDGVPVWTKAYRWCDQVLTGECLKRGVDSCGKPFPDTLSHLIKVDIPHNLTKTSLEFSSTLQDRSACEAAWGVDDITIYLRH